jgi:hypothetical protein
VKKRQRQKFAQRVKTGGISYILQDMLVASVSQSCLVLNTMK